VGGIGEWIMHNAKIPIPEYEAFAKQFNPVKFDAREWVRVAKAAGMKYMVITSKHHDGFSMYGTKVNDYNIVSATPYGRDPMKDLAASCKEAGIKFGFYYSIMDWHHPKANDAGAAEYEEEMRKQLVELLAWYDPSILWFDGQWVGWWNQEKGRQLERFLRERKPDLVINNRIGKGGPTDGDYSTPEQEIPKAAMGRRLWETCMTLNDTWGYKSYDHNWKPPHDVLRKLADIAAKGGNFLLNVGPDAEGVIPEPSARILEEVGQWLAENGEAIYATTMSPIPLPSWGSITQKGSRLYLIVFDWPKPGEPLRIALRNPIKRAALLKGGVPVKTRPAGDEGVDLLLPERPAGKHAWVVAVDFEGELRPAKTLAERTADGEPIPANPDGSILLPAAGAALRGEAVQLEGPADAQNVGYWTNRADYVEWYVEPPAPTRYAVELTLACAPGCGGEFVVAFGKTELRGESRPTGAWQTYTTLKLGEVALPKGKTSVQVRPAGEFRGALMNLRSVRLVPVK